MTFSLEKFEALAYRRDREAAMRELLALLWDLDANYGQAGQNFSARPLRAATWHDRDQHIWTRVAAAATCLLSDPELFFTPEWRQRILSCNRWLSAVFAATPFINADHVMRSLSRQDDQGDLTALQINAPDLLKLCLLYSPESEVPLALDALWEADKALTAGLCLALISSRFLGSDSAHGKREQILPWLSERLDQVDDIEQLPHDVLHDVYMHCSYADRADKHDIKKPVNTLIRRALKKFGLSNRTAGRPVHKSKPVILFVLEWFTTAHSVYRVQAAVMEAAREHFELVAMAYPYCVEAQALSMFDAFVPIDNTASLTEQLRQIQNEALQRGVSVCYMPSVGMAPLTMWLANLRVAPLQVMALGHPATTHSDLMDYVVVEEDYVGDAACFSETLIQLPADGIPYRPSSLAAGLDLQREPDPAPAVVQIAVCSTSMKLNPNFLRACARIADTCPVPVHFHFLMGLTHGLTFVGVQRVIRQHLGGRATVHPHQAYAGYMKVIAACDMFINPFPFGNTNGIIDTVSAGLVGVCKTGPEVHEHIDEGLFKRLQLPDWLIAQTADDYVAAAVRLASGHEERVALRKQFAGEGRVDRLFRGRPHLMAERLLELVNRVHPPRTG